MDPSERPLEGVKVLDTSRLYPGPFATMHLIALGASVDKLEDTAAGDYLRHVPPNNLGSPNSIQFDVLNHSKRSISLDLKRPEGLESALQLLEQYDVLLDGYRPGSLARLGLSVDVIRAKVPSMIVCALTGYGQKGENASRAGHDLNYVAASGLLGLQGPSGEAPQVPGVTVADFGGGLYAAFAIVAALYNRMRTGRGAYLDIAMTDVVRSFVAPSLASTSVGFPPARGRDVLNGGLALYNTYRTRDGRYVALAALEPKFAATFLEAAVGRPLEAAMLVPGDHQEQLRDEFSAVIGKRTRDEWERFADVNDCCLSPVLSASEVLERAKQERTALEDDARWSNDYIRLALNRFASVGSPVGPRRGQHTIEALLEAGMSKAAIEALIASGGAYQAPS